MSAILRSSVDTLPRKNPARASLRGEGAGQFLSSVNLGAVIDRAIALSGLTKDQASQVMGYANASLVSRWIANAEPPNLSRIWAAEELRAGFIAALAEHAGHAIEIETSIRIRRTA